jgi:toxin ParE1/3/4
MKLDLTEAAVADLRAIRFYTLEKWGAEQENSYLEGLWAKFEEILKNPLKFRMRPDLFPGCQIAAQGKHVILFRVQSDVLQIVRVFHGAMDFKRHLPG